MTVRPAHPEDLATATALIHTLTRRRVDAGHTQKGFARHVGLGAQNYGELERRPTVHVRLAILHRIAAGTGATIAYRLDGLPDPPMETALSGLMQTMWTQTDDPQYLSARLMARIAAARRWLDKDAGEVAKQLGSSPSAVRCAEQPEGDVFLGTPLALCRALGGRLGITLTDT
jgi:hypothetical protein